MGANELYLGIDVGGNHVKMGFVDKQGNITDFISHSTAEWKATNDFTQKLVETIAFALINHKNVTKVGIGLPGTINKERTTPIEIPSIPELNGVNIHARLSTAMPDKQFFLENDANAAALGEFYFANVPLPDDFLFITLGTGIGSAVIMDKKLFIGGSGNAMELGHIVSRNHHRLEQNIGKQGILNLAAERLEKFEGNTVIPRDQPISATKMVVAAETGDVFCKQVFFEVGQILGEGLVAAVRLMDIGHIIIGGGLSASFDFIMPGVMQELNYYLTPYYMNKLFINRAVLGNDAGLLGAASLCNQ
ncbi:MAG: ROK family protein [Flexibacteraceae bacterium]